MTVRSRAVHTKTASHNASGGLPRLLLQFQAAPAQECDSIIRFLDRHMACSNENPSKLIFVSSGAASAPLVFCPAQGATKRRKLRRKDPYREGHDCEIFRVERPKDRAVLCSTQARRDKKTRGENSGLPIVVSVDPIQEVFEIERTRAYGGINDRIVRQRRTITSSRFDGSFPSILRFGKSEIHTVFVRFSNLDLTKKLAPELLAELRSAALILFSDSILSSERFRL